MARCIELTPEQSREWTEGGGWLSLAIEDDIIDLVERNHWYEPIVVITSDKKIAFALTHEGRRA
jgi:hypothetical protein